MFIVTEYAALKSLIHIERVRMLSKINAGQFNFVYLYVQIVLVTWPS